MTRGFTEPLKIPSQGRKGWEEMNLPQAILLLLDRVAGVIDLHDPSFKSSWKGDRQWTRSVLNSNHHSG
jgi:hypothetical protein